jgi:hypothetical protein
MNYRINKLELTACMTLWVLLSVIMVAALNPVVNTVVADVVPVEALPVEMVLFDGTINDIQPMAQIPEVFEKGDAFGDGVVLFACAREIITMTVRADGVKSFSNHMVG